MTLMWRIIFRLIILGTTLYYNLPYVSWCASSTTITKEKRFIYVALLLATCVCIKDVLFVVLVCSMSYYLWPFLEYTNSHGLPKFLIQQEHVPKTLKTVRNSLGIRSHGNEARFGACLGYFNL